VISLEMRLSMVHRSRLEEGEQIGVDLVLVFRAHAMGCALVDLECRILEDLGRAQCRVRKLNSSFRLSKSAVVVFCDQHHPKARLPSHHLRVRRGCLIEWDGLDHRRHPTQGTETKRCVTGGRVSRQRACYLALSEYEIHARDL